jgi:hypothetical protein
LFFKYDHEIPSNTFCRIEKLTRAKKHGFKGLSLCWVYFCKLIGNLNTKERLLILSGAHKIRVAMHPLYRRSNKRMEQSLMKWNADKIVL